jgi:hypothetical protein
MDPRRAAGNQPIRFADRMGDERAARVRPQALHKYLSRRAAETLVGSRMFHFMVKLNGEIMEAIEVGCRREANCRFR